jgi:hypothetical protein
MSQGSEKQRIDDVLLNWRGQMVPDMRGLTVKVAEAMDRKLAEGISIDSAVEVLVSCGMPVDTVKAVAVERRRQVQAALDAQRPKPKPRPAEPATGYQQVATRVASVVESMPTDDALVLLSGRTKGTPALVKLTERQRAEFKSVLAMAKQTGDDHMIDAVHRWVAPHVETAIADSEILAERLKVDGFETSDVDDGGVLVREAKTSRAYVVDPVGMTCTCPRYVYGGFAHLGLACEHILAARTAANEEGSE